MKNADMKSGVKAFALLFIFVLMSCGSSNRSTEGGRISLSPEYQELQELVNSLQLEIVNQWAIPSWGGSRNLMDNPNYIRLNGSEVEVALPYFGVRHSGGGYGTESGIEFEGPVEDLVITEDRQRQGIILEFEGEQGNENLDFRITLYPNGNTSTSITSSQRASVSYRGEVKPLPEEQH